MRIERRASWHERIDIRDRDQQSRDSSLDAHLELIEVARLVVVNRRPRQLTQVAGAVRSRRRNPRQLGRDLGRPIRLEAVLHHGAAGDLCNRAA